MTFSIRTRFACVGGGVTKWMQDEVQIGFPNPPNIHGKTKQAQTLDPTMTAEDEKKMISSNVKLLKPVSLPDERNIAQTINIPQEEAASKKKQHALFQNPRMFYMKIIHASFSCFFQALALTNFNSLGDHLKYIYSKSSCSPAPPFSSPAAFQKRGATLPRKLAPALLTLRSLYFG